MNSEDLVYSGTSLRSHKRDDLSIINELMPYKQPNNKKFSTSAGLRPGQDVFKPKVKNNFPSVGMTLRSYGHEPSVKAPTRAPVRPSPLVTPKPKRNYWKKFRSIFKLKRIVITLLILILATGGYVGAKFVYNAHKLFGGNILSVLSTTQLKGQSSGRINILLAGNSADDPGHQGADLTDSIMLISIDTKDNQAFTLSIPRDLYVNIPGTGYQKINDAYVAGQTGNFNASGYPNGGMGQLEQVVQSDFGIPIDYYALVDYEAFKDAVNAVGGIQINIQSPDPRGLYDPSIDYTTHGPLVRLTNGEHILSGEQALDLARARGDAYGSYGFPDSDFDRTANQRTMIVALKTKAETVGILANPVKLSSLFDAIGSNVSTDLSLSEVHELYNLTKSINGSSIKSLSLNSVNGMNLLANYETPDGESALIPAAGVGDYDQIQRYLQQITSTNPIVQENAQVVVLNATDTNGLASTERTTLQAKNIDVSAVADATANQPTTTIIDNSNGSKPATKQLLEQLFGSTHITTVNPYSATYKADFIVVLGADQGSAPQQ